MSQDIPWWLLSLLGKEAAWNSGDVDLILWRNKWLSTPVFLPGDFHGQRGLLGYSPWGHKELDRTKQLIFSLFFTLRNL